MLDNTQLALLVLPMTLFMIGTAFAWLWLGDRKRDSALYFATSFIAVATTFGMMIVNPEITHNSSILLASFPLALSLGAALIGLSITQSGNMKSGLIGAGIICTINAIVFVSYGPNIASFVMVGEIGCFIFYSIGFLFCWNGPRKSTDKFTAIFMLSGVIIFAVRGLGFYQAYVMDVTTALLLQSSYFVTLQFFSSITIIGSGLAILAGEFDGRLKRQRRVDLTDPLSGLMTRKGLLDVISDKIENAHIQELTVSAIITDIDHFKSINDRFGHTTGDLVIECVGQLVKSNVRESDLAARIGGEEFFILLPGSDINTAAAIAERMRQGISEQSMRELKGRIVTSSFGVVPVKAGDTFTTILKSADKALYSAKNAGRNSIAINRREPNRAIVARSRPEPISIAA